jgi:hypothetical protein
LTSEELAERVENAIRSCSKRILGPGREQYEVNDLQRFETMDLDDLIREWLEELDDYIVYGIMTRARLERLLEKINGLSEENKRGVRAN